VTAQTTRTQADVPYRALQGSVRLWVGLNFFLYRILAPSNVPDHEGVSLALVTPFDT
jgi:hypothetical protein